MLRDKVEEHLLIILHIPILHFLLMTVARKFFSFIQLGQLIMFCLGCCTSLVYLGQVNAITKVFEHWVFCLEKGSLLMFLLF